MSSHFIAQFITHHIILFHLSTELKSHLTCWGVVERILFIDVTIFLLIWPSFYWSDYLFIDITFLLKDSYSVSVLRMKMTCDSCNLVSYPLNPFKVWWGYIISSIV